MALHLVYHPIYSQLDLPPEHRYPINKYRMLYQHLDQELDFQSHPDLEVASTMPCWC